jgi:hypothetical protein
VSRRLVDTGITGRAGRWPRARCDQVDVRPARSSRPVVVGAVVAIVSVIAPGIVAIAAIVPVTPLIGSLSLAAAIDPDRATSQTEQAAEEQTAGQSIQDGHGIAPIEAQNAGPRGSARRLRDGGAR